MRKTIFKIIIVSLVIIISASCNSLSESTSTFSTVSSELTDQSILTNNPCTAPCWNNLIPDQSSTGDTLEVLTHLAFIDPYNIRVLTSSWWADSEGGEVIPAILIRGLCVQPAETVCVEITVVEDKVKQISISPNYRITLEEVVGNWGDPEDMVSHPYGAECVGCIVNLFWSDFSMLVTSVDRRCVKGAKICQIIYGGGKIPPGYVVDEITYTGSVPSYVKKWSKDSRMPWPGFESP
jgi:hypothetical protein